jgi:hypothetical protein
MTPTIVGNTCTAATAGDTINLPSGTFTWTAGASCSGVKIVGTGAGRIIAISKTTLTLGTGTQTLTLIGTGVTAGASYGVAVAPTITVGQTLTIYETGFSYGPTTNSMTGTVTSWNSGTGVLVMNIASTTGTSGTTMTSSVSAGTNVSIPVANSSGFAAGQNIYVGTCCPGTNETTTVGSVPDGTHIVATLAHAYSSSAPIVFGANLGGVFNISNSKRWLVSTQSSTVIQDNSSTEAPMFTLTDNATVHTTLSGIKFAWDGNGTPPSIGSVIAINGSNSLPMSIVHDIWINTPTCSGGSGCVDIQLNVNHALVYNSSFDSSPFNLTAEAFHAQPFDDTAWSSTTFMGTLDTNGQHALYAESNDYHAFLNLIDNDEGARSVLRYSYMDHSGQGTHGVDTGPLGQRYFELYENVGNFQGFGDNTTFPMNQWSFDRGGTFVAWGNDLPAISSTDYGTKLDFNMIVENLNRNSGPNPCWGYNTTGGARRYAPRQVGLGNVTGTGTDGLGSSTYNATSFGFSATEYVGDLDPVYIWSNSRTLTAHTSDFSGVGACTGGTPDTSANYIRANTEYFIGTARPSYTAYTYPHPLVGGGTPAVTYSINGSTVTSYAFGFVLNPSTVVTPTITLTNTGTASLVVTSFSSANAFFSLTSNTCGSSFTLAVGANCTFTVTYSPTDIGVNHSGSVFTIDNTPGTPNSVNLSGQGITLGNSPAMLASTTLAGCGKPGANVITFCFTTCCGIYESVSGAAYIKYPPQMVSSINGKSGDLTFGVQ